MALDAPDAPRGGGVRDAAPAPSGPAPLGLEPVSLAQLQTTADLQTRVDRKYVVPEHLADALLTELAPALRVLEIDGARDFAYESVYFDSPDRASYLGAARGRRRRFKVRTRSYLDSGQCLLEVKTTGGRGETVKERLPYALADRARLTEAAHAFLADRGLPDAVRARLAPALTTRYRRATLLADDGSRATIDSGLECASVGRTTAGLPGLVIIETKSAGRATAVDRWLWRHHARPTRISKFGTGLAALDPTLPAHRWHRTLTRHVRTRTQAPATREAVRPATP